MIIFLMLSGCATSYDTPKWGKQVVTPNGWLEYCVDNPTDKQCNM